MYQKLIGNFLLHRVCICAWVHVHKAFLTRGVSNLLIGPRLIDFPGFCRNEFCNFWLDFMLQGRSLL